MSSIVNETLHYRADDVAMKGELIRDSDQAGPRPGVLVFPEAFGLSAHAKDRAARLVAERGYVALACDLHGDGQVYDDMEQLMPHLAPLRTDPALVRARTVSAFQSLAARPEVDAGRIAAIGFCFGGTLGYELALSGVDLKAAIGFHSGLKVTSPQDSDNIRGKILALIGADDPGVTAEDRNDFEQMLRAGGVDWQLHLYGGVVHSYTDHDVARRGMPDFLRYDAKADARSWASMHALLDEVFA